MGLDVASIGSVGFSAAPHDTPLPRVERPARATSPAVTVSALPDSPPPEVLDAMDAAARAYQTLRAQGRELRFAIDQQSHRVTITVEDLDGRVLRTIPPSDLLDLATGRNRD